MGREGLSKILILIGPANFSLVLFSLSLFHNLNRFIIALRIVLVINMWLLWQFDKTPVIRKTWRALFSWNTYVWVSMGKKCSFFGKFGVLCFLETPVLKFALLPYYRRVLESFSKSLCSFYFKTFFVWFVIQTLW